MNTPFDQNDPRLTAYALGEMNAVEKEIFETELKHYPHLLNEIAAIQIVANQLSTTLEKEALPSIKSADRPQEPKVTQFPYIPIGLAIAACFAAILWTRSDDFGAIRKRTLAERKNPPVELPPLSVGTDIPAKESSEPVSLQSFDVSTADAALRRAPNSAPKAPPEIYSNESARMETAFASPAIPKTSGGFEKDQIQQVPTFVFGGAQKHSRGAVWSNSASESAAAIGTAFKGSHSHENYDLVHENVFTRVSDEPRSTFSADVDTAAYSNVRRFIEGHKLPPKDAVRIEELLNYFTYSYPPPTDETPFAATMETASAPWAASHRLVRIGLKGKEISPEKRAPMNLVFLLDTSGSMDEPNRLPLAVHGLRMLVEKLRSDDRVAIVTYAGASGLALPSTPVKEKGAILSALESLRPTGSTNGGMGIILAYDIAKAHFIKGGINRVILCTDGDFNVGITSRGELDRLITEKARSGVFLTALGFGMGNYKDATIRDLADKGNGNYGYIDSEKEAKKLLVDQMSGTLITIAKDVKIQVEFNPTQVAAYRLIGYEKRALKTEDFNNDIVDAGEIGAGHAVTALYEIIPKETELPGSVAPKIDPLKYQRTKKSEDKMPATADDLYTAENPVSKELLTLAIRYKSPDSDVSRKLEFPLLDSGRSFDEASTDLKFATAVAGFGMLLMDSPNKGTTSWDNVLNWAETGLGSDEKHYRRDFLVLAKQAKALEN